MSYSTLTSDEFRGLLRDLQKNEYTWPNLYFAWETQDKTLLMIGLRSGQTGELLVREYDASRGEYVAFHRGISARCTYMGKDGKRYDPVDALVDKVRHCTYLGSWEDPDVLMEDPYAFSKTRACGRWGLAREQICPHHPSMTLEGFLGYFDFGYDVVSTEITARNPHEQQLRAELLEAGELEEADLRADLIELIDHQGAYLGDIDRDRFPINASTVERIIARMDAYIQDSVIEEFEEALITRGVEPWSMDLGEMMSKCKELGVGDGEVCYTLAGAIVDPSYIILPEAGQVRERQALIAQIQAAETAQKAPIGETKARDEQIR